MVTSLMWGIMIQKNNYITLIFLMFCIVLFFTGVFKMFEFDGKTKGCSSDNFFEYRETKSTEEILRLNRMECQKYRNYFKYWKYATFVSVLCFIGGGIYLIKIVTTPKSPNKPVR